MADTSTELQPNASVRKKSARKKLYQVHAWLGFHLAAIMALVLATGTIATVSHEIDWLTQHDMRVSPDGEKVSWGTLFNAVEAHKPGATITSISQMEGDHFAYRADVRDADGRRRFVHVNQWTGEVTGETHPLTVQRFFRDLHRYLFMPNFIGLPLVTSLAFVLAVSLYTGLKTTRNWRTLLLRVRTNKGARIMWGDAHKAAGLWGVWFFIVMIVTGIWYLIEFTVSVNYVATNTSSPIVSAQLTPAQVVEMGQVMNVADIDKLVEVAEAAYPELRITSIAPPRSANGTFFVQGMVGNPLIRPRSNGVFLHPETLEVLEVRRSKAYPAFFYINEMADPLHFGYFAGLPTKLIWFVFGIGMTGLSVTGVWLTWRRLKTSSPSKAQFATLPVLVVATYFGTLWYDRFEDPVVRDDLVEIGMAKTEQLRAVAKAAVIGGDTEEALLRLEVSSEHGLPLIKSLEFQLLQEESPIAGSDVLTVTGLRRTVVAKHTFAAEAIMSADELSVTLNFVGDQEAKLRVAMSSSRLGGRSN